MSVEEQVIIIDEQNNELEVVPRSIMRRDVLLHRATYVIVLNSQNELLIQKRSTQKDVYPGYYDPTTGGVVKAGENYDENAIRELAEEIGVKADTLESLFEFHFEAPNCNVWGKAFVIRYDGPIIMVDGEVEEYLFLPLTDIEGFIQEHDVMPDGVYVIRRFIEAHYQKWLVSPEQHAPGLINPTDIQSFVRRITRYFYFCGALIIKSLWSEKSFLSYFYFLSRC